MATLAGLSALRQSALRAKATRVDDLSRVEERLARSGDVEAALRSLSDRMFANVVKVVEEKLTFALQEVLEQPIVLRAEADYKRNAASVEFHIERDGKREDIMKGQGGSVANVLSVGLRMFALATLDETRHRRFLVLDEQDCWLRPELVPRLVKIVRDAGKELGFQVLMVSHHDHRLFERYADRCYRLSPGIGGVTLGLVDTPLHEVS